MKIVNWDEGGGGCGYALARLVLSLALLVASTMLVSANTIHIPIVERASSECSINLSILSPQDGSWLPARDPFYVLFRPEGLPDIFRVVTGRWSEDLPCGLRVQIYLGPATKPYLCIRDCSFDLIVPSDVASLWAT